MNPKVHTYREREAKNLRKVEALLAENDELERKAVLLENEEIVASIRTICLTPESLAEFLEQLNQNPLALPPNQNESNQQEDTYESNET